MKVIQCDICKQAVTTVIPSETIISAFVVCMACLERVPENLFNKFLEAAAWPNAIEMRKEDNA